MLSSFKEIFFEFVYIFKYICPVRHSNAQIRMTIDVTQKFFIYLLPWRQLWWVLKHEPCISVIKHVCVFVYVYVCMYMCVCELGWLQFIKRYLIDFANTPIFWIATCRKSKCMRWFKIRCQILVHLFLPHSSHSSPAVTFLLDSTFKRTS